MALLLDQALDENTFVEHCAHPELHSDTHAVIESARWVIVRLSQCPKGSQIKGVAVWDPLLQVFDIDHYLIGAEIINAVFIATLDSRGQEDALLLEVVDVTHVPPVLPVSDLIDWSSREVVRQGWALARREHMLVIRLGLMTCQVS